MKTIPLFLPRMLLASGALAALLLAPTAQALTIATNHLVSAETSDSARERVIARPTDNTLFDQGVESRGLGAQGQVSTASAQQSIFFDEDGGAFGSGEVSLALGGGTSGKGSSNLTTVFEITERSAFTLTGLFEAFGSPSITSNLSLRTAFNGAAPDFFVFLFDQASQTANLSGILDPGFYIFFAGTEIASIDPGESGSSRFSFDFRFNALDAGNTVAAPTTVALSLGGLMLLGSLRRRSAG